MLDLGKTFTLAHPSQLTAHSSPLIAHPLKRTFEPDELLPIHRAKDGRIMVMTPEYSTMRSSVGWLLVALSLVSAWNDLYYTAFVSAILSGFFFNMHTGVMLRPEKQSAFLFIYLYFWRVGYSLDTSPYSSVITMKMSPNREDPLYGVYLADENHVKKHRITEVFSATEASAMAKIIAQSLHLPYQKYRPATAMGRRRRRR